MSVSVSVSVCMHVSVGVCMYVSVGVCKCQSESACAYACVNLRLFVFGCVGCVRFEERERWGKHVF